MGFGIRSETVIQLFEQEHIHPIVLDHLIPALHITFDTTRPEVEVRVNLVT
jgi:hypothetical protein